MKIFLERSNTDNPYENLAMEVALADFVSRELAHEPDIYGLFLWQSKNAIVFGRNQCIKNECNFELAENHGVTLVRRNSGGGAVYHDLGNLNFTLISRDREDAKEKNNQLIIKALKRLGIEAEVSGRNDILVSGRKFSGNAYTVSGDLLIHHGTIMVNLDTKLADALLNPSAFKIHSKGVASVKQRIVNLSEINCQVSISAVKDALIAEFLENTEDSDMIRPTICKDIYDGELKKLKSKEWLDINSLKNGIAVEGDFGTFRFSIEEHNGIINKIAYESDILDVELLQLLIEELEGIKLQEEALVLVVDRVKASYKKAISDSQLDMINKIIVAVINSID